MSHVLFESQAPGYFSKALTAVVEPVLSDDRSVLAASLARPGSLAVLSLFSRFYLGHGLCHFEISILKLFCIKSTASLLEM